MVTETIEKIHFGSKGSKEVECNMLGLFNTKEEAEEVQKAYKPPKSISYAYMIGNHEVDVVEIESGKGKQYLALGSLYTE